jgi:hypothetical protein
MSNPHGIPGLQLRTLESYVERLAAIQADATSDELATLAYLVSIAKLEAEAQVSRAQAAKEERKAGPDDLWRPT